MYLAYETQTIYQRLKDSPRLQDVHILMAYPFEYQPSQPRHCAICLSPAKAELTACSLGEPRYEGSFQLSLAVFVPQAFGSPHLQHLLETVLCILRNTGFSHISAGDVTSLDERGCFTVSCTLTYPCTFYLTEENVWTTMREN